MPIKEAGASEDIGSQGARRIKAEELSVVTAFLATLLVVATALSAVIFGVVLYGKILI